MELETIIDNLYQQIKTVKDVIDGQKKLLAEYEKENAELKKR